MRPALFAAQAALCSDAEHACRAEDSSAAVCALGGCRPGQRGSRVFRFRPRRQRAYAPCQPSPGRGPSRGPQTAGSAACMPDDARSDVGRVVTAVMIDGKGPFRFIIDTGANESTISPKLAVALGLAPSSPRSASGSPESPARAIVPSVPVESLRAGALVIGALTAPGDLVTDHDRCRRHPGRRRSGAGQPARRFPAQHGRASAPPPMSEFLRDMRGCKPRVCAAAFSACPVRWAMCLSMRSSIQARRRRSVTWRSIGRSIPSGSRRQGACLRCHEASAPRQCAGGAHGRPRGDPHRQRRAGLRRFPDLQGVGS